MWWMPSRTKPRNELGLPESSAAVVSPASPVPLEAAVARLAVAAPDAGGAATAAVSARRVVSGVAATGVSGSTQRRGAGRAAHPDDAAMRGIGAREDRVSDAEAMHGRGAVPVQAQDGVVAVA